MKSLTGARAVFCAAHHSRDGVLHGHTWEVTAWVDDGRDVVGLKRDLQAILSAYDHSVLPDELAWAESMAGNIAGLIPGCVRVDVERPSEGFFARWLA